MLAKHLVRFTSSATRTSCPAKFVVRLDNVLTKQPVLMHSSLFSSSSNSQAESFEQLKFDIKKDGKRISASEYYDNVKKAVAKDGEESFLIPSSAFETVLTEYDELLKESADWKDKYQRSLAETENVRRRGVKQTEDAKAFAIQGFCKDLLEVADILNIAAESVKEEELAKNGKALKDLHDGIVMTKTVMLKTFAKHGLETVSPLKQKFDPNLHEAVYQIPSSQTDVPAGHVAHVAKIGYTLKSRPIRAAQVGVVMEN